MRRGSACVASSLVWLSDPSLLVAGRCAAASVVTSRRSRFNTPLQLSLSRPLSTTRSGANLRWVVTGTAQPSSSSSLIPAHETQDTEDEDFSSDDLADFDDEAEEEEEDFSSDDLVDEQDDDSDGEDAEDDGEVRPGDGGDGGGIVLGDIPWGPKALEVARTMLHSGGDFSLYGFKVSADGSIRVRLDKLSDEFGSPTLREVQKFNREYTALLKRAGDPIPSDVYVEVSSPGAERVLQIPYELDRFKSLPMQVAYQSGGEECEQQKVLELDSFEAESLTSVWRLANVRENKESLGKGRLLNKKQREWRLELPLTSIRLVRLHVDK